MAALTRAFGPTFDLSVGFVVEKNVHVGNGNVSALPSSRRRRKREQDTHSH